MPTILEINGIKFKVYFNDHGKPHVHVIKNKCHAKFSLETCDCIKAEGFSILDINKIEKFIKKHKALLLDAWKEYHEED